MFTMYTFWKLAEVLKTHKKNPCWPSGLSLYCLQVTSGQISQKKIAHSTVYHHPSISLDVQFSGLIKFREDSGVQM